jgi:hypothetical protein
MCNRRPIELGSQSGVAYICAMPTVMRSGSYRFHFYSDEREEPPHIHVRTPDGECKFWLEPDIALAGNRGLPAHEVRAIERLVYKHQEELRSAYHAYHRR